MGHLAGVPGRAPEPEVFDAPNAIEKLGVGRNMVRAMQFWGLAFKVIEPLAVGTSRVSGPMRVTELGQRLLADDGWDPYLEDPASLFRCQGCAAQGHRGITGSIVQ